MKKILTVLTLLMVIMCAVFAAEQQTKKIEVQTSVDLKDPAYKLYASMSDISAKTADLTDKDAATLDTDKKISEETIAVYFKIKQVSSDTADEQYARCKYNINIGVSVGPLTQAEADVKSGETAAKVAAHIFDLTQVDPEERKGYNGTGTNKVANGEADISNMFAFDGTATATEADKASSTTVKLKYNGLVKDQDIATFTAYWYRDETLPNGDYSADVKITYTIE